MRINKNLKVSQSQMVLKEGVVAHNDILDYDEFKDFIKKRLNEEIISSFSVRLNQIQGYIKKQDYKEAYKRWESLEREIFQNDNYAVSLLFIDNINIGSTNYQFKYTSKEYDVLGKRGKLSRLAQLKPLNDELFKESLAEQVGQHLEQFLNQVASSFLPMSQALRVFNENNSGMKERASNARWHTKDWTYRNIFYGDNPSWQGNAADAFMNHMAHMHVQILARGIENDSDKNLFAASVFQEEGDAIYDLLLASKNSTAWYTGGDIIFKYGGQLYNIQLKTGLVDTSNKKQKRSRIGGKLATKNLLALIESLKVEIKNQDIDKIIDLLYNELKTSGYVEKTNEAISKEVDKLTNLKI